MLLLELTMMPLLTMLLLLIMLLQLTMLPQLTMPQLFMPQPTMLPQLFMLPQLTMPLLFMPQPTMLPQLFMLPQLSTPPLPTTPQLFIMLPQHMLLLTQLLISPSHLPSHTPMVLLMTTPRLHSMLKRPMTVLEHPLDLTLLLFLMAVPSMLTTTPMTMMDMLLRLLMKAQLSTQRLLPTHWLMLLPTQLP